jgi:hypothetical protein
VLSEAAKESLQQLARQGDQLDGSPSLTSLLHLAVSGDSADAERALRQASERGRFPEVSHSLAVLRARAGDEVGADRIRRFGLADDGTPGTALAFFPARSPGVDRLRDP